MSPNAISQVSPNAISQTLDGGEAKHSTDNLAEKKKQLVQKLEELVGGAENAQLWLKSPHPFLDGKTPQSCLDEKKLDVVDYILSATELGQPL